MLRLSLTRSQRDFNNKPIINLQNSVSVRTYYIDIELLLLFFEFEYRQIIRTKEHADESSRLMGVDSSLLVSCRSLGGNQNSDKHRMVPPF